MWPQWSVFSDKDKLFIYKILKKHSYISDCVACKLYYIVIIMHNAILFRTPYLCIYTAKKKKRRRVVRLVLHRLKSPF